MVIGQKLENMKFIVLWLKGDFLWSKSLFSKLDDLMQFLYLSSAF
jgi:hypothetical protein